MAVSDHAINTAEHYATTEIGSTTNKRDVSSLLDQWAHKDTPFLSQLSWGADSGGLNIEWISEHLGFGYVKPLTDTTSASLTFTVATSDLGTTQLAMDQIGSGAMLFFYNSTASEISLMVVTSIATNVITYSVLAGTSADILTSEPVYIVGNIANEGSSPNNDRSRAREAITNNMSILRQDIRITGSMQKTDMYAVSDELQHQITSRVLEMQREREMTILLSSYQARSTTVAGIMKGMYGFLSGQSGDHIKETSQDFTEDSVNDVNAELFDSGATPDCLVGSVSQIRKFTTWDRARVRTSPDESMGGFHVAKYLTDVGNEIKLIPMRKFPANMAFLADSSKIHPRAKTGRKLVLEKLGKSGDFDEWQLISEFSLEMRGYDKHQHGMWTKLTS